MEFPKGFVWGAATSSFQIEGAWNADGKGPSVWDLTCHDTDQIHARHTGDVACDHYHKFRVASTALTETPRFSAICDEESPAETIFNISI